MLPVISEEIQQAAAENARRLGLSLPEYVSRLVLQDTTQRARKSHGAKDDKDPWGPVPAHVAKRWDEEERQFDEEEKSESHRPGVQGARSTKEFMGLRDKEASLLNDTKDAIENAKMQSCFWTSEPMIRFINANYYACRRIII